MCRKVLYERINVYEKRILTFVLVLLMLVNAVPAGVFAQEAEEPAQTGLENLE